MRTDARYRIRPAAASDLGAVAAIERVVFSDPWPPAAFRSLLGPFAWVAVTTGGAVAGYLFARHVLEEAEIVNVAVRPEHRRAALGRALVERLVGELARAGAMRVFLEVRESNAVGRAFYDHLGFQTVGRRRAYYTRPREDALVLVREIGAPSAPA